MGGWLSYSSPKIDAGTQTESFIEVNKNRKNGAVIKEDIYSFTQEQIKEMIQLYKEKQDSVDRSSIRGVRRTKDHYNSISKHLQKKINDNPEMQRPNFDPETLHRRKSSCRHGSGYTWYNDYTGKKVWAPWPVGMPSDHDTVTVTPLKESDHPKGYLTRITQDYQATSDEEMTVQKGIMVKVLRNHRDGRYEVYYSGDFGLVPGKVLSYVQYEPDLQR